LGGDLGDDLGPDAVAREPGGETLARHRLGGGRAEDGDLDTAGRLEERTRPADRAPRLAAAVPGDQDGTGVEPVHAVGEQEQGGVAVEERALERLALDARRALAIGPAQHDEIRELRR